MAGQAIEAPALGTLTFTPPANANGPGYTSFTFTVSDGTSESAAYTMTVDVTAGNDAGDGRCRRSRGRRGWARC